MKKVLTALLLTGLLTVSIAPVGVLAADPVPDSSVGPPESCTMTRNVGIADCQESGECVFATNKICGMCCLLQTLYNITDWIFVILVALVTIFVVMGAFTLLTSSGNTEKTKSGREYILYAAIGLLVGFLARAVPALVRLISGF